MAKAQTMIHLGMEIQERPNLLWGHKECRACGAMFQPNSNRQLACWECTPDKGWMHRYRRYGLTKPVYDKIMEKQNNRCPLCLEILTSGYNECVDHCHETLMVRGILCRGCNMVLSRFEDVDYVARVANYLRG